MKKLIYLVILAMVAKYLYQQPEIKAWVEDYKQGSWSKIMSKFTRPSYSDVKQQLVLLENRLSHSELAYFKTSLNSPEKTRVFFGKYCQGYQAMHKVLTQDNLKRTCAELEKYYRPK